MAIYVFVCNAYLKVEKPVSPGPFNETHGLGLGGGFEGLEGLVYGVCGRGSGGCPGTWQEALPRRLRCLGAQSTLGLWG